MSSFNDSFVEGNMEHANHNDPQQVDAFLELDLAEGYLLANNDWNWASPGAYPDDLSTDFLGSGPGGHSTPSYNPSSAQQEASLPIRATAQQQHMNPSPPVSATRDIPAASPNDTCLVIQHASLPSLGALTSMDVSSPETPIDAVNFGHAVSGGAPVIPVLDGSHPPQQESFTSDAATAETLPSEEIGDNPESEEEDEEQDESEEQQDSEDVGNVRTQKRTPKPVTMINGRPHFVPSMSCLLDPLSSGANTQTEFAGVQEANEYLRARSVLGPDPTIPRNDLQKKAIVCAMLNLMKNTEYALDNDKVVAPFEKEKWSNKRLEASCWQVLEIAIDCHIKGPLLTTYNGTRPRHNFPTFADRMAQILEAIGMHKTICKHIMDPPYLYFFVDDPLCAQKRVKSNKALNQRKGVYMRAGQAVLQPRTPRHRRTQAFTPAKRSAKTPRKSSPRKTTPQKTTSPAQAGPVNATQSAANSTVVGQESHHAQSQQSTAPGNVIYPVHPPQAMNAQAGQQSYGLVHSSGMTANLASSGPMASASVLPAEPAIPYHQHQGFPVAFGSNSFNGTMPAPVCRVTLPTANTFAPYIAESSTQFHVQGSPGNVHQFASPMFDQSMMYAPSANVGPPMMGAPIAPGSNGRKRGSLGSYQYHDGSPGKRRC